MTTHQSVSQNTQALWAAPFLFEKERPFLSQERVSTILVLARFAIAALLTTGVGIYFQVNMTIGWALIGTSVALFVIDCIRVAISHRRDHEKGRGELNDPVAARAGDGKSSKSNRITYSILSWNIATMNDYSNLCAINEKTKAGKTLKVALEEFAKGPRYEVTDQDKLNRLKLFQEAFAQLMPDIICLQEAIDFNQDLSSILPSGYATFSGSGRESCTVAWNTEKFTMINNAKVHYDPDVVPKISSELDAIVQLKDLAFGTTICVASAHLEGFVLSLEEGEQKQRQASYGDKQANYDLATMEACPANVYIFAGDLNATREHYPKRLDMIEQTYQYKTALGDEPTILDASLEEEDGAPKAVKMDYIFAKGERVGIRAVEFKKFSLNDFNRPSDHLPVAAIVELY